MFADRRSSRLACLAVFAALTVFTTPASAASNYWGWYKDSTVAANDAGCHRNALDTMGRLGFESTKSGGFYVEGVKAGVTVIVTCTAGTDKRRVSFVLFAYNEDNVDTSVVEQVYKGMKAYVVRD
jgi:hypothetical protein